MNSCLQSPYGGDPAVVSATATEPGYRIRIDIEGLTSEELALGAIAARTVFDAAGITPRQAACAQWEVEGWDHAGFPDPSPKAALDIHDVWFEADVAAIKACRPEWDEDRELQAGSALARLRLRSPLASGSCAISCLIAVASANRSAKRVEADVNRATTGTCRSGSRIRTRVADRSAHLRTEIASPSVRASVGRGPDRALTTSVDFCEDAALDAAR